MHWNKSYVDSKNYWINPKVYIDQCTASYSGKSDVSEKFISKNKQIMAFPLCLVIWYGTQKFTASEYKGSTLLTMTPYKGHVRTHSSRNTFC